MYRFFRNISLKNNGLCLSHYLSAPALDWDAMVNVAKVELELFSDRDMHLIFEEGIRCRVSYISKRYSKANNKYLKYYEPKQDAENFDSK